MNWTTVGKSLASLGLKALGGAVGGPVGAAMGGKLAGLLGVSDNPSAVSEALATANPEHLVQLKKLETEVTLANIAADVEYRKADSADLSEVNTTMRAEGKSDHWPVWAWRPFNGFLFGITMFSVYFVLPLMKITPPKIDYTTWMMWAAVLGVTSMGRNALKQAQEGNKPPGLMDALASRLKAKG